MTLLHSPDFVHVPHHPLLAIQDPVGAPVGVGSSEVRIQVYAGGLTHVFVYPNLQSIGTVHIFEVAIVVGVIGVVGVFTTIHLPPVVEIEEHPYLHFTSSQ